MALDATIRSVVSGTVKSYLSSNNMLTTVQIQPQLDGTGVNAPIDKYGQPQYWETNEYQALVEDSDHVIRLQNQTEVIASYCVTFFEDIPISQDDLIVVGDKSAPIHRIDRGVNPGVPFVIQVYIGEMMRRR